jgi:ABC-type multidrug transport system fused ATPase/permease subunit
MRNAAAAETVNGISVLKFFSWEGLINKHVENMSASDLAPARLVFARRQQVAEARKRNIVALVLSMFNEMACSLVAVTMFGVYSYMGKTLTLTQAFPAFLYISIMKTAGNPLLGQTRALAQAKRSLEKLSFFCTPKNMPDLVNTTSSPKQRTRASFAKRGATLDAPPEVRIKSGSFDWGSNQTGGRDLVLRGINVVFPAGKITAIIGKASCGKTSLLAALLGEMNADPASVVQLGCAVALSSQEPWIRNASVRDNILFGCPMDSARYADVLRVCALQADLNALPAGDMTEIGGKGSVLSPSQKQRISVARAVYCGADVYMFDDPLAPLSSAEASLVFSSCFLEHLAGSTRILVTHKLDVLERVDHIVCMTDEGGILCCGNYADISSRHPEVFSSLIKKRRSLSDSSGSPAAVALAAAAASLIVERSHAGDAAPPPSNAPDKVSSSVTRGTYKFYVEAMGRNCAFAVVSLGALAQVSRVLSYLWIAHWVQANRSDPLAQADWNYYVTIFGLLIASSAVLMMLRDAALYVAEVRAAGSLHARTLRSLLRAPLSFFASTPASSVISHLTVGQDAIDSALPRFFNIVYNGSTAVLCAMLTVTAIAWPFVLLPLPILYFFYKTAQCYIPMSGELKRLQATVEPRINSLLSEAHAGAHIIRAFGLVDSFFIEIENRVDALNRVALPAISVKRWLGVRMELCANFIVTFSCLAAVFAPMYHPGYVSSYAALIALALSEAFAVKDVVLNSVRCCVCMIICDLHVVARI